MWSERVRARAWLLALGGVLVCCGVAIGVLVNNGAWQTPMRGEVHRSHPASASHEREANQAGCRATPVKIRSSDDLADLVSDRDLGIILVKLIPRWEVLKAGKVFHALRLWGSEAQFNLAKFPSPFADVRTFSGKDLFGFFMDHEAYLKILPQGSPILFDTRYGVGVRNWTSTTEFEGSLGHVDQLLSACGQLGLPSSTPIQTPSKKATIADMIEESTKRFDPAQELEWTAEAFALYLPPQRTWTNRFGKRFSFDDVARSLLGRRKGEGPCYGIHVPYALMSLLRVDQKAPILEAQTREKIRNYFGEVSAALMDSQDKRGFWPEMWTKGVPPSPAESNPSMPAWKQPNHQLLISTCHHLEWITLAPPELRPPRECVEKAVAFMAGSLKKMPIQRQQHYYMAISHAARALCLMKKKSPMEILDKMPPAGIADREGFGNPTSMSTANRRGARMLSERGKTAR